jgi:hypothetical protein
MIETSALAFVNARGKRPVFFVVMLLHTRIVPISSPLVPYCAALRGGGVDIHAYT